MQVFVIQCLGFGVVLLFLALEWRALLATIYLVVFSRVFLAIIPNNTM